MNPPHKKLGPEEDPPSKSSCCHPCWLVLAAILGIAAITLALLFGLGVIGSSSNNPTASVIIGKPSATTSTTSTSTSTSSRNILIQVYQAHLGRYRQVWQVSAVQEVLPLVLGHHQLLPALYQQECNLPVLVLFKSLLQQLQPPLQSQLFADLSSLLSSNLLLNTIQYHSNFFNPYFLKA